MLSEGNGLVKAYLNDVLRRPLHLLQPLQDHLLIGRDAELFLLQGLDLLLYSVWEKSMNLLAEEQSDRGGGGVT